MNPLRFSFNQYAQVLGSHLVNLPTDGSTVVAITGPWGSGKTTLMRTIAQWFDDRKIVQVYFNAWAFSKQDAVWRGLFLEILHGLRTKLLEPGKVSPAVKEKLSAQFDEAEKALYLTFTRETAGKIELDLSNIAKTGVKLGLRMLPGGELATSLLDLFVGSKKKQEDAAVTFDELWGLIKRSTVKEQVARLESIEQFRQSLHLIVSEARKAEVQLLVMIDDADRCLPDQTLDVLEAIRLFLDLPGAVFLVAMDLDILQHALDRRYEKGRIQARVYSEKMFDLTFAIPAGRQEAFRAFIADLPASDLLAARYELIATALPLVPRTWIRYANALDLAKRMLTLLGVNSEKDNGVSAALVKTQLLGFWWPQFMRAIRDAETLSRVEKVVRGAQVNGEKFLRAIKESNGSADALRRVTSQPELVPAVIWQMLDDELLLRTLAADDSIASITDPAIREAVFSLDHVPQSKP